MRITSTSDNGSLSFSLILYDSQPIYHRQSTDIPTTINGQHIGRVLAAISTKIHVSPHSRTICRPTLGRYIGQYVDQHILVNISAECQSICRPMYQPSVGRYVDRYIGRGQYTNYTWSSLFSFALKVFSLSLSSAQDSKTLLAGILKAACSVLPSMLNAALPVGAVLTTFTSSGFFPSDTI